MPACAAPVCAMLAKPARAHVGDHVDDDTGALLRHERLSRACATRAEQIVVVDDDGGGEALGRNVLGQRTSSCARSESARRRSVVARIRESKCNVATNTGAATSHKNYFV